jgi:hypothetical protein
MSNPSASPLPSSRRLSVRKGSTSAYDPHAVHAELNLHPSRSSSSTLSIVRLIPQPQPQPQPTPSAAHRSFRRQHPSTSASASDAPAARLSFALNSFTTPSNTSPSTSPRLRPSSPTASRDHHHRAPSLSFKPRLSADQIYDLAKQATNPANFPVSTPSHEHPPRSHSSSPIPSHSRNSSQSSHGQPSSSIAPATFTPLTDDICLPFIDRPSEVAALISTPPTARLFALLEQTFPKTQVLASIIYDPTAVASTVPVISDPSELPKDSTTWSYSNLHLWLTSASRSAAPDPLWIQKTRKCIFFHSELIWERVKGALGVPPELDVDGDQAAFEAYYADQRKEDDGFNTDEMEDAGRKARGYWDDWDAVMDSPIFERRFSFRSSRSASPRLPLSRNHSLTELDKFRASVAMTNTAGLSRNEVTLTTLLPMEDDPAAYISVPGSPFGLSIEPLIATGLDSLSNTAPNEATGLGDIAEAEEEAPETSGEEPPADESSSPVLDPSRVMGIKISTTAESCVSPLSPASADSPVRSYFPGRRSASSLSLDKIKARRNSSSSLIGYKRFSGDMFAKGKAFETGGYESEGEGYDPVGDRAPGNPLFPSNFARLALGPTLAAK